MGAFDEAAPITLPNPDNPEEAEAFRKKWKWEPHEQIILQGSFTAADREAVDNASALTDKKQGVIFQAGTARLKLVERMVKDWTLMYRGNKVKVSMDAIKRLPSNYLTPILDKCDEIAQSMSEEEQQDFLDDASEPIVESFVTENLLPLK